MIFYNYLPIGCIYCKYLSFYAQKACTNCMLGYNEFVQIKEGALKMNKEELVQEISKKAGVTQKEAVEVLNALIETVQKSVAKGKKVTLVGFGTFERRDRAARVGRNPQTGKELKIPATKVPAFSAGKRFKTVVNGK